MATLYRATDSKYAQIQPGACGFRWWTPSRQWAETYGAAIIERDDDGLSILDLPLDGPEVREALEDAGVDTDGIAFTMSVGDDDEEALDLEVHQILSDRNDGPVLARRLKAAGFDGVRHPDHVYEIGVGEAVALVEV